MKGARTPWRQVPGDVRSDGKDKMQGMISANRDNWSISGNIYACKLRVRAYNCATAKPSDWSQECVLASEKEEKMAVTTQV